MTSCSPSPVCLRQGRFGVFSEAIQGVEVLLLLLAGTGKKRFCPPSV